MTDIDRLAQALFGGKRAESQEVSTDATTRTYIGVATSDSTEGTAYVSLDGDVTLPDDIIDPEGNVIESYEDNGIEMSVGPSIHEGDEVIVTLVGGGPLKTPMVTSVAGEGDRQDAAIDDAARAAETAWNWADEAHDAATTAQERADEAAISASEAAASASAAQTSANTAQQSASTAATAAASAQGDAATAASAAANAQADASSALSAATSAQASAASAASDAATASAQASAAQASATRANTAANSALTQLSVVEDVAGTLQWISDHGTFTATTDTTVQEGVVYFAYDGGDYVPIAEPTGDPSAQGWYVLDVSESQTEYVMSHIAVTSRGLWVLPSGIGSAADEQHAAGYKLLLASDGSYLYDSDGQLVTASGESITLSSSRPQYIGGENAYIIYYDSDDDGIPDTIRIGGRVLMGGSKTLSEVLSELEAATSTEVVGRNLLRRTGSVTTADLALSNATVPEAGTIRLAPTASVDAGAKFKVDYLDYAEFGEGTYTVSLDAREVDDGSGFAAGKALRVYVGFNVPGQRESIFSYTHDRYTNKTVTLDDQWTRYELTFEVPAELRSGQESALAAGSMLTVQPYRYRGYLPVEVRNVKLERGERATAWTLAPEDLVGITSTTVAYGTSASASTEPSAWQATAPTVTQGQWLWTRTVTAYTDGTSTTSYSKSYVGTDGAAGTSVTVSAIEYGTSANGTTQPTSWQSTVPATAQGQWLWTRTTYTDGTSAITKAYIGTDGAAGADGTSVTILGSYNTLSELQAAHPTGSLGDSYIVAGDLYVWDGSAWSNVGAIQGPQGPAGADGASVTVSSVAYGTSASASTQPTSWSATAPASIAKGSWLWVRTTYSDSTETVTKSYVGTDGEDGKSVFVQSATKSGDTTTVILSDGTTQTTLTISDGMDGANGADGLGGYVHTAWANSADGSTDFSTTVSAGKLYLGVYTDHSAADSATPSDYSWSLIKGADGADGPDGRNLLVGTAKPKSVTLSSATSDRYTGFYAESDHGKSVTAGNTTDLFAVSFDWTVDVPEGGTPGGEAWVQIESSIVNNIVDAGGYGARGKGFMDLSAGSGHYWALFRLTSTQANKAQQRMRLRARGTEGYLACPGEVVTIGSLKFERTDTGPTGWSLAPEDLVGVSSTTVEYGTSDSASAEPSTWSATAPTSLSKGVWLWTRATTTYTDGSSTVGTNKSYVGTDGADGTSVYVQSATKSGDTTTVVIADSDGNTSTLTIKDGEDGSDGTPGANGLSGYVHVAWATSADGRQGFSTTVSAGKTYLGTYTDHTQADSQAYSDYSWSLIKGADGESVTVTKTEYGISTSASAEPTWSTTVPTSITKGRWLWVRTTYSDGSTTVTKSYVGTDGTNGTDGEDGTGITSIVEQYYLSTSNSTQTGGSWSNNQPAWQSGRYIWTRSQITWDTTPATVTTTTPVLAQALNGANSTASSANATATEAAKRTYVSIRVTAIDYDANTATLQATLFIDGTAKTSGVTYAWLKDGSAISGATARAYSVPASNGLDHAYSCKCTW